MELQTNWIIENKPELLQIIAKIVDDDVDELSNVSENNLNQVSLLPPSEPSPCFLEFSFNQPYLIKTIRILSQSRNSELYVGKKLDYIGTFPATTIPSENSQLKLFQTYIHSPMKVQYFRIKFLSLLNKQKLTLYDIEIDGQPLSQPEVKAEEHKTEQNQNAAHAQLSMLMMGLMGKVSSISTSNSNDSNLPNLPSLDSLNKLTPIDNPKKEVTLQSNLISPDIEKIIDAKLKALEERLNQRIEDANERLYRRIEALFAPKPT